MRIRPIKYTELEDFCEIINIDCKKCLDYWMRWNRSPVGDDAGAMP